MAGNKRDEYGLTSKWRQFADLYRAGPDEVRGNAKQCYWKIYPKVKESTAETEGPALLRKSQVAAYLELKAQEVAAEADVDAKWLMDRLVGEADADLADLFNEDGTLKSIHDWPIEWRRGLVSGLEVSSLMDGEASIGMLSKIKQLDRTKIKELIGKLTKVGAFSDKLDITSGGKRIQNNWNILPVKTMISDG